jgi:hypothetical protein
MAGWRQVKIIAAFFPVLLLYFTRKLKPKTLVDDIGVWVVHDISPKKF